LGTGLDRALAPREENQFDLEIEAVPREQSSVLLVGDAHVASTGLRTVVAESRDLHLVAEVIDRVSAVSAASEHSPDHILFAAGGLLEEGVLLLHELRDASPESTLTVCTYHLDRDMLLAAKQLPVDGILMWMDVTSEVLHETLRLAARGFRVNSVGVEEAMLAPSGHATLASLPERERPLHEDFPELTEDELLVLDGLEAHLQTWEIPQARNLSSRTMHRKRASLQQKLGAHTLYDLGKRVLERRLKR
jgi:DNA-binding NarL/FixJ family response regulator